MGLPERCDIQRPSDLLPAVSRGALAGATHRQSRGGRNPPSAVSRNRELSRTRAEGVLAHLQTTFKDPDLDSQVGLLWLGEEYAQLDPSFCQWKRSGSVESCTPEDLNRSAFITWIDCRL